MRAVLHFLGEERELSTYDLEYHVKCCEYSNMPLGTWRYGGILNLSFNSHEKDSVFEENILYFSYESNHWGYYLSDGKLVFYDADDNILKTYRFYDAVTCYLKTEFSHTNGMTTTIKIAAAQQYYGAKLTRWWLLSPKGEEPYKTPVIDFTGEQSTKKPFGVHFTPSDEKAVKEGVYGFDSIPSETIVTSSYTKLEEEYHPLPQKLMGEKYVPPFISMRAGQKIRLKLNYYLDTEIRKNGKRRFKKQRAADSRSLDYVLMTFQDHPDFEILPKNLLGVEEVTIICKRNNPEIAQLVLRADKDLVVGAINIFYPKPKTIDLQWHFVEITGGSERQLNADEGVLRNKITKVKLTNILQQGFNSALIDFNILNKEAHVVDISKYKEELIQQNILRNHPFIGKYVEQGIENSEVSKVLNLFHTEYDEDKKIINVYFINRKCLHSYNIPNNLETPFPMNGGLSPTNKGIAYIVLDHAENMKGKNIIHEVMHALGLPHIFDAYFHLHQFYKNSTPSYIDYSEERYMSYKWQWVQMRKYRFLK